MRRQHLRPNLCDPSHHAMAAGATETQRPGLPVLRLSRKLMPWAAAAAPSPSQAGSESAGNFTPTTMTVCRHCTRSPLAISPLPACRGEFQVRLARRAIRFRL